MAFSDLGPLPPLHVTHIGVEQWGQGGSCRPQGRYGVDNASSLVTIRPAALGWVMRMEVWLRTPGIPKD
jgi:hypothetical protein